MKRYFVETNAYNMVVFVDVEGNAYAFYDTAFDEPLTLETAMAADYSNCEGCETAEDIMYATGVGETFTWNEDEFESVTEF